MDVRDVDVIAPNFKRRLSGVTSTIIQLVPKQRAMGTRVAVVGPGLPDSLPTLRMRDLPRLWRAPGNAAVRVWHARRNVEMLPGVILRDVLRMPLRLVFTSASQRRHTRWTKFLIRRMDAVIATSRRTADYLEVENTVVMHGIDTDRFSPPADRAEARAAVGLHPARRYVGCFGRIRRQKGTDVFVDAMIAALPRHPDWSAVIAGRTTSSHAGFEQELRGRVSAAGLEDRILFVGEHTAIHEWYKALDLFVAPQRWEGFGLTPLEAMACGVPVVATDVGAFSELVVDGVTGAIIPPGEAEAMAAAAGAYMSDDEKRQTAGQEALRRAREDFPLEKEAEMLARIYARVASGAGSEAPASRRANRSI
ncbi:glycosyltransferase family 4 protein [Aquibium sp. LZ166]|uniref:Glycosyltransferase family 4 protein n=1 Tax=Aquibium pacificus TaxID=3153579 RepID=A0ABV3SEN6_9HYPH